MARPAWWLMMMVVAVLLLLRWRVLEAVLGLWLLLAVWWCWVVWGGIESALVSESIDQD
jgi:hypothetical protein